MRFQHSSVQIGSWEEKPAHHYIGVDNNAARPRHQWARISSVRPLREFLGGDKHGHDSLMALNAHRLTLRGIQKSGKYCLASVAEIVRIVLNYGQIGHFVYFDHSCA
jgi:hypothetical protein